MLAGFRVEKDSRRLERRCPKHDDLSKRFVFSAGYSIDERDALRLACIRIDGDLSDYRVWPERHSSGRFGHRQSRAQRVKHRPDVATIAAVAAVVTTRALLHPRLR